MLSRDDLLNLISDEKNKYSSYLQLCQYFKVKADPLVTLRHQSQIETLEMVLDTKPRF